MDGAMSAEHPNVGLQSPLRAVRAHCLCCCDGNAREAALCPARRCPLWLLRSGHRAKAHDVEQNADVALHPSEDPLTTSELHNQAGVTLRAIRRRCIDCAGGSPGDVRTCSFTTCPLHPFRLGKNPNRRVSPERKAELLGRLHR
jgi:hypothetical protein